MNKVLAIVLMSIPLVSYSQSSNPKDSLPTSFHQLVTATRIYYHGDTVANLKSLNIGLQSYQISKESADTASANGLEIKEGAVIVLKDISKLKHNFQFYIKTKASDAEFYENKIEIRVKDNDIRIVNITTDKIEMATGFRSSGKIYVVIAVSMILFFTIIFYLIFLERKTRKLEKQISNK